MYCQPTLGKFLVPSVEDWVPGITYQPEPPVFRRGVLNPWRQESQRVLWLAENAAWAVIQRVQAEYKATELAINQTIAEIQEAIRRIEEITGRKSGLAEAGNYAMLLYSLSGGPYAWAIALGKMGLEYFLSMGKKHKLGNLKDYIEGQYARYTVLTARLQDLAQQVSAQLAVSEQVKSAQATVQAADMQAMMGAVEQRRQSELVRGAALQALNRQAAQLPSARHRGSDAL